MSAEIRLRRMVLALHPDGAGPEGLRAAAEFARGAGLDLLGLFLEDEAAVRAAGHGAGDAAEMEAALRAEARGAERRLRAAAEAVQVRLSFERLRGAPEAALASRLQPADMLALLEPADALGRAFGMHRALAALAQGRAPALALPVRPSAVEGAVAVAASPQAGEAAAPAVALGARLARAAGAPLEVWDDGGPAPEGAVRRDLHELAAAGALRPLLQRDVRLLVLGPCEPALRAAVTEAARRARTPLLIADGKGASALPG